MNKVTVIAEAGKNWLTREDMTIEEALNNAKELASQAKSAGADAVKFQCHVFQDEQHKRSKSRWEWIQLNEKLTPYNEFWLPLKQWCDAIGIEFMCTPMSWMAAHKIQYVVKRWKVASPDINDVKMLEFLMATGKQIIISNGMSTFIERLDMREMLRDYDYKELYCVSLYPCPVEDLHIHDMHDAAGLSDHTMSLITGALAVIKGAEIIEKHFTVNGWGKDAHMSLSPVELEQYISNIHEAERAIEPYTEYNAEEMALRKVFKL